MNSLNHDFIAGFFDNPEPPCLSIYQTTHRHHPDNQQDLIRFRNLVKALEQSLQREYSARDAAPLLEPFHKLAADSAFWNCTLNGLAVLGAPGFFRTYRLQRPVPELAIVANSFHLKPLVRILQSADGYQILGVSRQQIRFFEGNRDALDEVEVDPAVPRTPSEAQRREAKEFHVSAWTSSAGAPGVHSSEGSKSDLVDNDATRFYRAVDRAILEHYSRPSRLPLLLAALPENQSFFRALSHNSFLLPDAINYYPDDLSADDLRARAWEVMEPHYLERLSGLIEMFGAAKARELGSDDVLKIAESAVAARVATLLIEANRQIPGGLDPVTGETQLNDLVNPQTDDLLDDIGELVLKNGGQVIVVPRERMPTQSGIAAIYRF
jgi:hypothetical protein